MSVAAIGRFLGRMTLSEGVQSSARRGGQMAQGMMAAAAQRPDDQGDDNDTSARGVASGASEAAAAGLAMAGLTGAVLATANHFAKLNKQVVESQRRFANYNGTIAASMQRLEVGRVQRDIKTGQVTAESTKYAAEAQNRLEEAQRPAQNLFQNMLNTTTGFMANAKATFWEQVNLLTGIEKNTRKKEKDEDGMPPQQQFLLDLAAEERNIDETVEDQIAQEERETAKNHVKRVLDYIGGLPIGGDPWRGGD